MKIQLRKPHRDQRGFSLIELLIAMLVLAVGLLGGMIIITAAVGGNARARFDSAAVALAQSTMERILVIPINSTNLNSAMTDCNGVQHPISSAVGGAPLTNAGDIDFRQARVANYQMFYALCAAGGAGNIGNPQFYDVRWRVSAGPTPGTQVILVAAKNRGEVGNGLANQSRFFAQPITLRGFRGN